MGPREGTKRANQERRPREQAYRNLRGFLRQTLAVQSRPRKTPKHSDSHCKDWTKTQRHCRPHLNKEMGRHQCKSYSINLKSNMLTPEPSGHTKGRLDHPNPEEVQESYFKCNFMKMMENFKEEVKHSLPQRNGREDKQKNGRH